MRTPFTNVRTQLLKCHQFLDNSVSAIGKYTGSTIIRSVCQLREYSNGSPSEETRQPLANPAARGVVGLVNEQITNPNLGRLFAVVHFAGNQYKITNEDLLLVKTNPYFPDVGERIVLEKVLLVGSENFTLIGRPILDNVRVEATIIEKTLGYEQVQFHYIRRKNVRKMKIFQELQTVLRITSITANVIEEDEID